MLDHVPESWGRRFGLAVSPLFEQNEIADPTKHHVFLDGGRGTFALSLCEGEAVKQSEAAGWAWSSDIAHHVTLTDSTVSVVRWDSADDVTVLSKSSVENKLDEFYRFISSDRIQSNRTVVLHLLSLFRRIRSLVSEARIPDARASEIFLFALAQLIFKNGIRGSLSSWGIGDDVQSLYSKLDPKGFGVAVGEVARAISPSGVLALHPALAVRHAGGLLFQEAHFELLRAPSIDFFGHIGDPELEEVGRGGAHFTPPALARSLVEQAVAQIPNLSTRTRLTVCDPACGSGVFLHEVLRVLRRRNFKGEINLVGRDISPVAITMAKFVLKCASRDWPSTGGIHVNLEVRDSLEKDAIPSSDLILMNPPFISWSAQSEKQRSQLISIVGRAASSRGDLSMAFVVRGLESLSRGGVIGVVFPASLLSQQSGEKWREKLSHEYQLKFLGAMGDYGLFTHALVQVACGVFTKDSAPSQITALVASNDSYATGDALRTLRKLETLPPAIPVGEDQWSIFGINPESLRKRKTWRLRTPVVDAALKRLEDVLPYLGDLFNVRQGVQTGCNPALLLNLEEWSRLPKREREHFRKATMSDSIRDGAVIKPYYLFFPYTEQVRPLFKSENDLKKAVPDYYERFLRPNKERLSGRASIKRSGRNDWWGLMEARSSWSADRSPRIISKYFSGEGGFVVDSDAEYLPSTGFAWLPKSSLKDSKIKGFPLESLLCAYAVIFNSATFGRLLQYYAPHVSGGQFDLSPRYVNSVPLPALSALVEDPARGQTVKRLVDLASSKDVPDLRLRADLRESLVADLYGPKIISTL